MDVHPQSDKLVLYTYFRSSTAWRVRIVLNLKHIPHEFRFVHLVKGQQKSEDYKKINPNGVRKMRYRPCQLCFCLMDKSSSSRWPSVNTWNKHTLNIRFFPKIQSKGLKFVPSVRWSTLACILTKIYVFWRKWAPSSMQIK